MSVYWPSVSLCWSADLSTLTYLMFQQTWPFHRRLEANLCIEINGPVCSAGPAVRHATRGYDPGTLPSSANQCVPGKMYVRFNLSREQGACACQNKMLHPNDVHCRPANFTVSSGAGSAANIAVADMEAARVSSPSCHTVVLTIAALLCSANWQTCSFAFLCSTVPHLSEASRWCKSLIMRACVHIVSHFQSVVLPCHDVAVCNAVQSYVDILDAALSVPVNTAPVPLPAAGSGPNGAVGTATFNMTASSIMTPAAMAVQTAG